MSVLHYSLLAAMVFIRFLFRLFVFTQLTKQLKHSYQSGCRVFFTDEQKYLYHPRWDIESSFCQLKYSIGLRQFQSKKVEFVTQEIFYRLLMYNFCELITSHAIIQNKHRKYVQQTSFSAVVHICRQFFQGDIPPPYVKALICQYLVPIRNGRSTIRKTKNI